VKRTGRKRPLRIARRRGFRPFRLARMPGERRIWLEVLIGALVGLVLGYFYDKELDKAQVDCEARGGKLEVSRMDHRCELPGEPAAP